MPTVDPYGTLHDPGELEWGPTPEHSRAASVLDDAHFSMRKPRTRTGLSVSTRRPAYRQRVTYRISVWDERPEGYAPTAFAWVCWRSAPPAAGSG